MDDRDIQREERAIYLVAILVMLPVVVVTLVRHADFDGGTTLCLVAVVLGALGLVTSSLRALHATRLPRARVRTDKSP